MKTKVACHVPRFNIKHLTYLTYYALVTNNNIIGHGYNGPGYIAFPSQKTNLFMSVTEDIFVEIESLLDILSNRILHPLGIFALLILAPNNIQCN